MNQPHELWQKAIMVFLGILSVELYLKRRNIIYFFSFDGETLIVQRIFEKLKQYTLKKVTTWTENEYFLLGFRTNRIIIIEIAEVTIQLISSYSKDYDTLSKYLNENLYERGK